MLLAFSDVTFVLIGWFKFLLLKFIYEYGPRYWPGVSQQLRGRVIQSLNHSFTHTCSSDIDLESVSSYSDDDYDDSSLSDSDYIIVPMPDCFDLTKPLRDLTISSYSASSREADLSFDDNHNNMSQSEFNIYCYWKYV